VQGNGVENLRFEQRGKGRLGGGDCGLIAGELRDKDSWSDSVSKIFDFG